MRNCDNCLIKGTPVNHVVFDADIMVVGESPGHNETIRGIPFIGKSGQLLDFMLEKILGVRRGEVAIANATMCTVPASMKKSKKMIKEAIAECRPNLLEAIEKVKPKYIISLGEIALQQLLGRSVAISTHRGRPIKSEELDCTILPTYHPSAVLRNGGIKQGNVYWLAVKNDFMLFREIIHGTVSEDILKYQEYRTNAIFSQSKLLAVDAEWDEEGNLLIFSISDGDKTAYVLPERLDQYTKANLRHLFRKPIVFANRPADERILARYIYFPSEKERRWMDIFNIARLLFDNIPNINLDNIVSYVLNERDLKKGVNRAKISEMHKDELIKYNCRDAELTARAFKKLFAMLNKDTLLKNYWFRFTKPVEDMLASISTRGFKINRQQLMINKMEVEMEMRKLEAELLQEIPASIRLAHRGKLRLTRNELITDVLFTRKGFNLKPIKYTASGSRPSVDEDTLIHYKHVEWVDKLLRWKKINKLLTTYFGGLEKNMDEEGYIYPSTVLYTTVTGRTSCFNPNLQNIPRSMPMVDKLKSLFAAPEGWVIGTRDLSQSELRIIAWLAQEETMLKAIRKGEDLHLLTASLIMKKPKEEITKEERHAAKAVNFGFIYGAQASTFQKVAYNDYGLSLTLEEAEKFRKLFFDTYKAIELFHKRCVAIVQKYKHIRSPLGRLRRLPHIDSDDFVQQSRAIRQAINFPVQSFSSDLALIGMYLFWKEIRDKKTVRLLWFIHDSVFFMCRKDLIEKYMNLLKECMEQRSVEYIKKNFNLTVGYPVSSEGKIGTNWANLVDEEVYYAKK